MVRNQDRRRPRQKRSVYRCRRKGRRNIPVEFYERRGLSTVRAI